MSAVLSSLTNMALKKFALKLNGVQLIFPLASNMT